MSDVRPGSAKCCIACRRLLPADAFSRAKHARDGRQSRCKECDRLRLRGYRTPEQQRAYYAANRDTFRARVRRNTLMRKYGLTVADYETMCRVQGGVCAVCGLPPRGRGPKGAAPILHVDHDHKTNLVRELLCSPCNQAIGLLADDPERAMLLALYLERHRTALKEAA